MATPVLSRESTRFALAVTAGFLVVTGLATLHHEMWRDEMDAWLVARDSVSPFALFWNIRYGGHPSLWYLLLWPLPRITRHPAAMQGLNLLVAATTAFLVAKHLPAPRWVRVLAVLGYFPVYEYGTIARDYMLGVLCLTLLCVVSPRRRERPLTVGLAVALAAHTTPHATILALAWLLAWSGEALLVPPVTRRARTWIGLGIGGIGVATAIWQMSPPPDAAYAEGWYLSLDPERARTILGRLTEAYVPMVRPGPAFWRTELLPNDPRYEAIAPAVSVALLAWIAVALARRPLALVYYLCGSIGLLAFFYLKFDGFLRHHGHLFVCLGTALWLARTLPARHGTRPSIAVLRWCERSLVLLVPVLLGVQVVAAAVAVAGEYRYVFSGASAAARLMRHAGVDSLPMIGDQDTAATAVLGYLDKDGAYYPAGRRFGSYILWNRGRLDRNDPWSEAASLARSLDSVVAVVVNRVALGRSPPPAWLWPRLHVLGCQAGEIVPSESFCVILLRPGGERPLQ